MYIVCQLVLHTGCHISSNLYNKGVTVTVIFYTEQFRVKEQIGTLNMKFIR